MEQKRVSFKVAKAIKVAGYPQESYLGYREGESLITYPMPNMEFYVAPTYLDAWLWLWREKGIEIELSGNADQRLGDCYKPLKEPELDLEREMNMNLDPEEAIIAAIEYLVDNTLIK